MKTVHEVCELTGVTRKRLFYYDKIGLLKPTKREGVQKSKMYNARAVEQLRAIMQYQDAGLRLSEIRKIIEADIAVQEEIMVDVLERLQKEYERKEKEIRTAREILQNIRLERK